MVLFSWLLLCWALGCSQVSSSEPFKNHSSVHCSLFSLVITKTHWLSKLDALRCIFKVQVLKAEVPDLGFKSLASSGVLNSIPTVHCYAGGWMYSKTVSQPLLLISMWVFSYLRYVQEWLS